jgi:hypothetical protein
MNWIYLAQDSEMWRALVNVIMDLGVSLCVLFTVFRGLLQTVMNTFDLIPGGKIIVPFM